MASFPLESDGDVSISGSHLGLESRCIHAVRRHLAVAAPRTSIRTLRFCQQSRVSECGLLIPLEHHQDRYVVLANVLRNVLNDIKAFAAFGALSRLVVSQAPSHYHEARCRDAQERPISSMFLIPHLKLRSGSSCEDRMKSNNSGCVNKKVLGKTSYCPFSTCNSGPRVLVRKRCHSKYSKKDLSN